MSGLAKKAQATNAIATSSQPFMENPLFSFMLFVLIVGLSPYVFIFRPFGTL